MNLIRGMAFIGAVCALTATSPSCASAVAPSITSSSGAFSPGKTVDIYGSGFGAKAQAAPIRYDDFETGTTVGNKINVDLPWWSMDSQRSASISSSYPRSGSTKCGKFFIPSEDQGIPDDAIYHRKVGFASTGKIYINYWVRWDWGTSNNTPTNYFQIKTCAINYDVTSLSNETPQISIFNYAYSGYPNAGGYTKSYWANYWYGGGSGPNMYLKANGTDRDLLNTVGWYNISLQVDMGTPGTANGSSKTWTSGVEPAFPYSYGVNSLSNVMILGGSSNTSRYIDDIRLGWYRGGTTTGSTTLYYDNIYIDNSWARVEIGDKNTYDSCTHREMQIPATWADGHISIKANAGSFASGKTVYLYVVDENGVVNTAGYPVTIGSSSTSLPAPSGPSVSIISK